MDLIFENLQRLQYIRKGTIFYYYNTITIQLSETIKY